MASLRTLLAGALVLAASSLHAQDVAEQLFAAARKGDAAAVKALLDKGVDVNAKARYDRTALSFAAHRGHGEVVKVLLERGAALNVKDTFYGMTPVVLASSEGHTAVVKMLLDKGAEGGGQVLMSAVRADNRELVSAILAKGGLDAETLSSALGAADRGKRVEIAEMLRKAGAVPPPKADFQVDADTLQRYAGLYRDTTGMEIRLAVKDGKLTGGPVGQPPVTLGAFNPTTFRVVEMEGITLIFNLEEGKVTGMTMRQGGNTTVFKKVEAR